MRMAARILSWAKRLAAERGSAVGKRMPVEQASPTLAWKQNAWWQKAAALFQVLLSRSQVRSSTRRLRFVERVSLGDKQYVALLELDGVSFLASGSGGGSVMLKPAHKLQGRKIGTRTHTRIERVSLAPKRIRARTKVLSASTSLNGISVKPPVQRRRKQENSEETLKCGIAAAEKSIATQSGTLRTRKQRQAKSLKLPLMPESSELSGAQVIKPVPVINPRDPKPSIVSIPTKESTAIVPEAVCKEEPATTLIAASTRSSAKEAAPADTMEAGDALPLPSFAALLELRMLATQVFEQAAAETLSCANTEPDDQVPVDRVRIKGDAKSNTVHDRVSRFRRRIGGLACFLMLLMPHGIAHAAPLQMRAAELAGQQTLLAPRVENIAEIFVLKGTASVLAFAAHARTTPPSASDEIRVSGLNGLGGSSASWGIVVLLTLLTLIPSLLLCVTPFARLLIVFHFLRQALGLQTTPSNQTLIGLSLILTFFIMQPVGAVIYRDSVLPVQAGKLTPLDGVVRAGEPLRHFMAHYVREKDAQLFLEIAKEPRPRSIDELSMRVMLPAYILSELKAGFQIGTILFLPFLIVDMVVASITTSVGMVQLPPVVISTPLKLLLFLMVDGWHLLIGALMRSFN